nr:unnamed protein product [Callosobruchus chinensis]
MSHLHTFTKLIWYIILLSFVVLTLTLWMTLKVLRKFRVREPPLSILTCFLGVTSGFINQGKYSLKLHLIRTPRRYVRHLLEYIFVYAKIIIVCYEVCGRSIR